jgi:hypothetical protein
LAGKRSSICDRIQIRIAAAEGCGIFFIIPILTTSSTYGHLFQDCPYKDEIPAMMNSTLALIGRK